MRQPRCQSLQTALSPQLAVPACERLSSFLRRSDDRGLPVSANERNFPREHTAYMYKYADDLSRKAGVPSDIPSVTVLLRPSSHQADDALCDSQADLTALPVEAVPSSDNVVRRRRLHGAARSHGMQSSFSKVALNR